MKKLQQNSRNQTYREEIKINLSKINNKSPNNQLNNSYTSRKMFSDDNLKINCYNTNNPFNQSDVEILINLNKKSILYPLNKTKFNNNKNISFDEKRIGNNINTINQLKQTNKINNYTKIVPLPNYQKIIINCILIQRFIRGFLFRKAFKKLLKKKNYKKFSPTNYGKISNIKPIQPIYTLRIDFNNKKSYIIRQILKPKISLTTKSIRINHYKDIKLLKILQKYIKQYLKQKAFTDFLNSTFQTYSANSNNQSGVNTPMRNNWSKIINLSWLSNSSFQKLSDKSINNSRFFQNKKKQNLNVSNRNDEKEIKQIKKYIPKPIMRKGVFISKSPTLRQKIINSSNSPINNTTLIYKKPKDNSFNITEKQINKKCKINIPKLIIPKNKKIYFEENSSEINYTQKKESPNKFRNSEILESGIKSPYYRKTISTQNTSALSMRDKLLIEESKVSKFKNENEISIFTLNYKGNEIEDPKILFQFIYILYLQYNNYLKSLNDNIGNNDKQVVLFNKKKIKENDDNFSIHKVLNLLNSKEQKKLFYESFNQFIQLNNNNKKENQILKNINELKINEEKETTTDEHLQEIYNKISKNESNKLTPIKLNEKKYHSSKKQYSKSLDEINTKKLNFMNENKEIIHESEISSNSNMKDNNEKKKEENKLKEHIINVNTSKNIVSINTNNFSDKPNKLNNSIIIHDNNNSKRNSIDNSFKNNLSTAIEFQNKIIYPLSFTKIFCFSIPHSNNIKLFNISGFCKIKSKYFYIEKINEESQKIKSFTPSQKPPKKKIIKIRNNNISLSIKKIYPITKNLFLNNNIFHVSKLIKNFFVEEKSREISCIEQNKNRIFKPSKLKKRINNKNKLNKGETKINFLNLNGLKINTKLDLNYITEKKVLKEFNITQNLHEDLINNNRNLLMCRPLKGMKKIFNTIFLDIIPKNKQIINNSINNKNNQNNKKLSEYNKYINNKEEILETTLLNSLDYIQQKPVKNKKIINK